MSIKAFLFFHFVRPLWSVPLSIISLIITVVKWVYKRDIFGKFKYNLGIWNSISSLDALTNVIKQKYSYRDEGFFDRDKLLPEFLTHWGDCDDVALHVKRKLKELGLKAFRVFMYGKGIAHCDCAFYYYDTLYFFNYGVLIPCIGEDLMTGVQMINPRYKHFCKCLW